MKEAGNKGFYFLTRPAPALEILGMTCLRSTGTARETPESVGKARMRWAKPDNTGMGCFPVLWQFERKAVCHESGALPNLSVSCVEIIARPLSSDSGRFWKRKAVSASMKNDVLNQLRPS